MKTYVYLSVLASFAIAGSHHLLPSHNSAPAILESVSQGQSQTAPQPNVKRTRTAAKIDQRAMKAMMSMILMVPMLAQPGTVHHADNDS